MDKGMLRATFAFLFLVLYIPATQSLNSSTEKSIRAATFEFVAPGSRVGLQSLVGSAFAIGPNEFVTAAHLFTEAIGGEFDRPKLIDSDHIGYQIGDLLRFSEQQDYVVFSLEHPPLVRPLTIRPDEQSARDVYFAGWRSGNSVVIERGAFSGLTRDKESGEFDWLRFSGQVWGSVGGGPVLDDVGHVIGIVQGRSLDAGANYAVPISLLSVGSPEIARIHATEMLRSLMPAVSSVEPLKGEIPLPMTFEKFAHELQELRSAYFDRTIGPLLEATRSNFVLTGAGAADVCNLLNGRDCECKSRTGISGMLVVDNPRTDELIQRVSSGEDVSEKIAGVVILRTRPDRVARAHGHDLSSDSLLHLSLALKGQPGPNPSVTISTKIASRSSADQDLSYVDFHGRSWYMRTWPLGNRDLAVISLARELSDGYVVLTRVVPAALTYAAVLQVKFIANVVYSGCEELQGDGDVSVADNSTSLSDSAIARAAGY
jgi:serine protease Do